jgi:hypothetical protein
MIGVFWVFKVATRLAIAKQESVKTRQAVYLPARVKRLPLGRGRYL